MQTIQNRAIPYTFTTEEDQNTLFRKKRKLLRFHKIRTKPKVLIRILGIGGIFVIKQLDTEMRITQCATYLGKDVIGGKSPLQIWSVMEMLMIV